MQENLEILLAQSRAARALRQEAEEASLAAEAAIAKAQVEPTPSPEAAGESGRPLVSSASQVAGDTVWTEPAGTEAAYAKNAGGQDDVDAAKFVEADPSAAVDSLNSDAFFEARYDNNLRKMIEHVVSIEGPVLDSVLARRIARVHGWQRTGARIQERVSGVARSFLTSTDEDVGTFFWAQGRGPEIAIVFRSGSEDGRTVDEICMAELRSLAEKVSAKGKTGDSAVLAMAHELGLQRVKAVTRARFEKALAAAQ